MRFPMRVFALCLLVVIAFVLIALGEAAAAQDDDDMARAALALARAKLRHRHIEPAPATSLYKQACEQSQQTKRPLAVFVGQAAKAVEGFITVAIPELNGDRTRRVLVAKPGTSWPQWVATLMGDVSPASIRQAVSPATRQALPRSVPIGFAPVSFSAVCRT